MSHTYALGAVKPWVKSAAQEVGDKFDISTIYGVGMRAGQSDHPIGLATDFMVYTDRSKGDAVASYCKANWQHLNIKYIIWWQRIDEGSGFKPMEDRGGTTANHKDHVHVSYNAVAGGGAAYSGSPDSATADSSGSSGSSGGMSAVIGGLTSVGTWVRVLMFLGGAILIAVFAWSVVNRASA